MGIAFGFAFAGTTEIHAELLTNGAQVLSISAERAAQKIPVHVVGIVTAAEPGWGGKFFVQDETSGVFVANRGAFRAEPGDIVDVTGATRPGSYAPVIVNPKCKKLGDAPLPEARNVPIEQVMSGFEDGQRVEVVGRAGSGRLPAACISQDLDGHRSFIADRRASSSERDGGGIVQRGFAPHGFGGFVRAAAFGFRGRGNRAGEPV